MNELIVHKHALAMHQEKFEKIGKKMDWLMDQPYSLKADEKMTQLEMESKAARDSIKFHKKSRAPFKSFKFGPSRLRKARRNVVPGNLDETLNLRRFVTL